MSVVGQRLYSRGGPLLIGVIIGFILNQKMNGKQTFSKLGRIAVTFMWLMIMVVVIVTANATFNWNKGKFGIARSIRFSPCSAVGSPHAKQKYIYLCVVLNSRNSALRSLRQVYRIPATPFRRFTTLSIALCSRWPRDFSS